MQSRVIMSGEPLLQNDVPEQVKDPAGVYYDVDREGHMRKLPDEGPPGVQSALMVPVKLEGEVVGVVQLMHETVRYDDEQLELAEGLVGLMAAAVRNARLHEQAQAEAAARARGRGDGRGARAGGARARGGRRRRDDGRPGRRAAVLEPRRGARHRALARRRGRPPGRRGARGLAGGRRRDPDLRGGRARPPGDAAGRGGRQRALALVRRPSAVRTASSTPSAT